MKVGFNMGVDPVDYKAASVDEDDLKFAAQMGATHVVLQSYADSGIVKGDARWEYDDLVQLRHKVESAGLVLEALENVPLKFYDQVMLGGLDRDRQIENMFTQFAILPVPESLFLVITGCLLWSDVPLLIQKIGPDLWLRHLILKRQTKSHYLGSDAIRKKRCGRTWSTGLRS